MPWENASLLSELTAMGFSSELAQRAITETKSEGLQIALDWLLAASASLTAGGSFGRSEGRRGRVRAARRRLSERWTGLSGPSKRPSPKDKHRAEVPPH